MRVAIFPVDDDSAASARIRAYTLQRSLIDLGHDVRLGDATEADILLIQKKATPRIIELAARAREAGALVVYDADDLHPSLWNVVAPTVLHRLLPLVDVVTTDTFERRAILLRDYGASAVEVVPDAVDYYPTGPVRPTVSNDGPLRLLWFGNPARIELFARLAEPLIAIPEVEVVVATHRSAIPPLAARFPRVTFVPWSREGFVSTLQSCSLTVLSHDGTESDRAKSNNRMITSITWGVPSVVSRTPEYERTAIEAGVGDTVFSTVEEMVAIVMRLRSAEARAAYLDAAQPEIWRRYSPHAVARTFLDVVAHASRNPQASPVQRFLPWLGRASRGDRTPALLREARHRLRRLAPPKERVGR